jgi:hypothetical protein
MGTNGQDPGLKCFFSHFFVAFVFRVLLNFAVRLAYRQQPVRDSACFARSNDEKPQRMKVALNPNPPHENEEVSMLSTLSIST